MHVLTFRYRAYPSPEQVERLGQWENALRFLWNLALEQRLLGLNRPKCERVYLTAFDQINQLTDLRAELPWLADVPRDVSAQLLIELDKAWQRCFKRIAKAPRWKRKRDSLSVRASGPSVWRLDGATLHFPKLGLMPVVLHRPIVGKPKTCTLVREIDQWFVCITCEIDAPAPNPRSEPAVGIDRGVVNLTADSDGKIFENPRYYNQALQRLARAQRRAARCKKGSSNQKKARVKVAKLHRKVRRQRAHTLHVLSATYAKSHGTVVVEKLNVKSMSASAEGTIEKPGKRVRQKAGLNRGILDSGWSTFVQFLRYKLEQTGGTLVEVPAAYSSQTCSACAHISKVNRVSQAVFLCEKCGHSEHADVNAAKVVLSRRIDGGAVCGGSGVSRPVKQKLRVARRGTNRGAEASGAR